jgi:hypothetical protein
MRQILETEDHVVVPPMMYSDPFYRMNVKATAISAFNRVAGKT